MDLICATLANPTKNIILTEMKSARLGVKKRTPSKYQWIQEGNGNNIGILRCGVHDSGDLIFKYTLLS